MKKIALICHFYVHYRIPVLNELATSDNCTYYFIGDVDKTDDIERVDFAKEAVLGKRFIPVKNKWLGHYLLWQKGLMRILKKQQFDSVIFLGDIRFLSTWVALVLRRLNGKKSYLWSHGIYGKESWLHLQVKLLFLKLANGIFLYGNKAKEQYLKHGVSPEKLVVIYNSLNFKETEIYRKLNEANTGNSLLSLFKRPELPVVFCIGRLTKVKKIAMLVEAIDILKNRGVFVNCFVIGDGEESKNLKELVTRLSLEEQIHFTGALYNEKEISRYIMVSDLCVCPGAVGLTVIHSLSYGVPVLSNDNFVEQMPEHEAIIAGKTGDFFKDGDINDMANKIQQCINYRLQNKERNIQDCVKVVSDFYNPNFQKTTINNKILSDLVR